MTTISTPVTRLLGIRLPVVQAGMSWVSSTPELPLAVTNAGGLGVLAVGPVRIGDLDPILQHMKDGTDSAYAVNLPLYRPNAEEVITKLLANPVPIIITSQGGPRSIVQRFHDVGTKVVHVVASTQHAYKAAEAGVDGLIVVGGEAGGHPPADQVTSLAMLRAVARRLPEVPLIGSGGFADGAGLAAALSLGAGAAQFGTRFILSTEANVHPAYQRAVMDAQITDTRTVGRDIGVIRTINNRFAERMIRLEAANAGLEERRNAFTAATLKMAAYDGDVHEGKVEAGQSAGLVDEVLDASEIVRRITEEYLQTVAALPGLQAPLPVPVPDASKEK